MPPGLQLDKVANRASTRATALHPAPKIAAVKPLSITHSNHQYRFAYAQNDVQKKIGKNDSHYPKLIKGGNVTAWEPARGRSNVSSSQLCLNGIAQKIIQGRDNTQASLYYNQLSFIQAALIQLQAIGM